MIGKKINQLATELAPVSTDLTIIGDPTTGVSKKITLAQLGAIFSGAVSFYTNYASFPATGDINVIYCAKDTQKLYLWSGSAYVEVFPSQALLDTYQLRSEKGNANGYASLDSSGKVPVSQLPSSIMEYKGTWSAATNTPTLANGTGDTGDVYICNAAGSVNFGAGSITFAVGDYVIYSGSIWQRSSGAVGTVTSVAASITGNAIGITGSPVTTSGTLAFAFAGTGAQYIKGDGTLATFPSIISQAQNLVTEVYNSTGATLTKGTVVYINGGQGNLPTVTKAIATGDSTSAQTYGIVQADITNMNNGYVVVAGRLLDIDTQAYSVGTQLYLSSTTAGAYTSTKQYAPAHLVYVGIIVRSHPTQGVIEVKIQNGYELDELHNVAAQTPTNNDGLFWEASTNLWKNKSLATIIGGTPAYGSGTQNRITKFTANAGELINSNIHDTGSVIYNNNPSDGQFAWQFNGSQTTGLSYGALIVAGTNASDIALRIQNASSTSEYFFVWGDGRVQINNIPNATTDTDRFLVSDSGVIKYRTGTQLLSDIGGQPAGTYVTSVGLSAPTGFSVSGSPVTSTGTLALAFDTGYSLPTIVKQNNWDTAYNTRIVTASSPLSFISNTISISQASGSTSGYLSSTDWNTFNNKQSALTNPVTGTGTTNYLPKFTGTSTIGNSIVSESGSTISVAGGITASGIIATSGTGLNSSVRISNTTSSTGRDWHLYSLNNGNFGLYNNTDGAYAYQITPSGNLGIGTSSPAYKLQVTSTAAEVMRLQGTSGGGSNNTQLRFYGSASASDLWAIGTEVSTGSSGRAFDFYDLVAGANRMRLDASGNLGLGVTPSAWGSIFKALQIGNRASIFTFNNVSTDIGNNVYFNGTNYIYIDSDYSTFLRQNTGQFQWLIAPSGTAGNVISFTQAMTLNASGNLSIGNTNDTYKLDVTGTARLTDTLTGTIINLSSELTINRATASSTYLIDLYNSHASNNAAYTTFRNAGVTMSIGVERSVGGAIINGGAYTGVITTVGTKDLNLATNEIIRLNLNGSTGAATFSSSVGINGVGPTYPLYVRTGTNQRARFVDNGGLFQFAVLNDAESGYSDMSIGNSAIVVKSGGNVGIGTTSPIEKLDLQGTMNINGASGTYLQVQYGGANRGYIGTANAVIASGSTGDFGVAATSNLIFGSGGSLTERMRITSGGEVLINMTTTTTSGSGTMLSQGSAFANVRLFGTGSHTFSQFFLSGTAIGSITGSGSTTSYNTSSDYRLKQDLKDFNGLDLVSKLKAYDYEWKADKSRSYGVIAHELQSVINYAVTGVKDGEQMQGVDYSKIVPVLIKAIQEQQTQIEQLKNK